MGLWIHPVTSGGPGIYNDCFGQRCLYPQAHKDHRSGDITDVDLLYIPLVSWRQGGWVYITIASDEGVCKPYPQAHKGHRSGDITDVGYMYPWSRDVRGAGYI